MHPLRIALLDDHPVVRAGVAAYLSQNRDIVVLGEYESSRDLILAPSTQMADLLLIDYSLGPTEMDGISLIKTLRIKFPAARILVLSALYDPATVALALRSGAHGFVGKGGDADEIVRAVRKVAAGGTYCGDQMTYLLSGASTAAQERQPAECDLFDGAALSAREREVIRCLLEGMTISEIAAKFARSPKTISAQKATAYRKLGVTTDNALFKLRGIL
ncbi:response regulator [Achromobacter kerstersii]|uniref:response regulator n=1 Tax=Achromobacter kerstersii TaxID=1353890 RepID=UPI003D060791